MTRCCPLLALWLFCLSSGAVFSAPAGRSGKVFILPIREEIGPPLVYLVRRGIKETMAARADLLILDMDTPGGRFDTTEEILRILGQFKGETVTYVNHKALSAGAFIAFGTRKIFMAPGSVIGAAAPFMLGPGGPAQLPETVELKMTSAIRALVRASAETNGYNLDVVEAMIDKNKELKIGDEVLNPKGQILTLTATQAEKEYGSKPLLSSGTVASLDELLIRLNHGASSRVYLQPSGFEKFGSWLNRISPLLMLVGMVGIYLEMKTPGFGLPGIVGIAAFALYFCGGYIAGLSGLEWLALFLLGLGLLVLELFVFPGTFALGLGGVALMVLSLVMSMVDLYPGLSTWPSLPQLKIPLTHLSLAILGTALMAWIISRWLPKTPFYRTLVSQSASGVLSAGATLETHSKLIGLEGRAISTLRPGGKAKFGEKLIDVVSQGELIEKGRPVKITGYSGTEAIVEVIDEHPRTPPP